MAWMDLCNCSATGSSDPWLHEDGCTALRVRYFPFLTTAYCSDCGKPCSISKGWLSACCAASIDIRIRESGNASYAV